MTEFSFRNLLPGIAIGTASDRYAGWLGQIYTPGKYDGRITVRQRRLGGRSYEEKVLPVASVAEYFEHFPVLEIDFTFYRTLLDSSGKRTENYHALEAYAQHLGGGDRVILKAPQVVFARRLFRGGRFVENGDYLDPEIFAHRFYEPACAILGGALSGFVFEQEYQKAGERVSPEALAAELRVFLKAIPEDRRYHFELRTDKYLADEVFRVLEEFGVGQVFSHWTWLPPLRGQYKKAGERFFNGAAPALIRLLTPLHKRYDESYSLAHPFDRFREEMLSPGMVDDTIFIMEEALKKEGSVTVIVNNRAAGNAPLLAQRIADVYAGEDKAAP